VNTTRRNQLQARIEANQAEIERLQAEAELIDAMPDLSTAPVGSVVAFITTFRSSAKPFTYVAFKSSPTRWYVTGEAGYKSDEELAEFLTSRTRKVISVQPLAEIAVANVTNAVDLADLLRMLRENG